MKRKCRLADMVARRHLFFAYFLLQKIPNPYLAMELIERLCRLWTNNDLERIMKAIRLCPQIVCSFPAGELAKRSQGSGIVP